MQAERPAITVGLIHAYRETVRAFRVAAILTVSCALAVSAIATPAANAAIRLPDTNPVGQIIGGTPANRATTPWFVSLSIDTGEGRGLCGGTAISTDWILTAAHCVNGMTNDQIAGSEAIINPTTINAVSPSVGWASVSVHPGYDSHTQEDDFALIQTTAPMPVTPLRYSSAPTAPVVGTKYSVYGFGVADDGNVSSVLRVAKVADLAGGTGNCGIYGGSFLPSSMICAGYEAGGIDSCQGDSGGPLIGWAGQKVVVGTVSWGDGCAEAHKPGVYGRVASAATWIATTSGVAGLSSAVLTGTPAIMSATRPCSTRVCVVRPGKPARFRIHNAGEQAASWKVAGKLVRISSGAGNLAGGKSAVATINVPSKKKGCSTVTAVSGARKLASVVISLNGKRC